MIVTSTPGDISAMVIPFSKLLIFIEKGKKTGVLLPFGKGFDYIFVWIVHFVKPAINVFVL